MEKEIFGSDARIITRSRISYEKGFYAENSVNGTTLINVSDRRVFSSVYKTLFPYTFFYARRFVSPEDADDIVAAVFSKLWTLKEFRFSNIPHLKGFLRVCIKNACLTQIQQKKIRTKKAVAWEEERELLEAVTFEEDRLENAEIHAEKLNKLMAAIEKLPLKCRRVIKMAYLDGLKNKQIADSLGVSENTIKTHKKIAIKRLRIDLLATLFILIVCRIF